MRTMRVPVLCTVLALVMGNPAPGRIFAVDPTLSIPATVTVQQAPSLATIPATTNCSWVGWYSLDPTVQIVPPQLLKDSHTCVCFVTSATGGRVLAYTGNDSGPAPVQVCTVTLATPPPPPPPTDPLAASLATAFQADTDPAKATKITYLAALFNQAATNTVQDQSYATVGALLSKLSNTAVGPLAATDLPAERVIVSSFLSKYPASQALDAGTRTALGVDLAHVATALDSLTSSGKHTRKH